MAKQFMQRFTGCGRQSSHGNAGLVKLVVLFIWATLLTGAAWAQPVNDSFTNATVIAGLTGTGGIDNLSASIEACESTTILCNDYLGDFQDIDNSIWFQWTATQTGPVEFDTTGSDFDTVLIAYATTNGLCDPSLIQVDANDDDTNALPANPYTSRVNFMAVAGTTYYISVAGNAAPATTDAGNVVLNWSSGDVVGISSGAFRLTSSTYVVSDRDSSGVLNTSVSPSIQGARITVTRTNGSTGRVLVDYQVAPLAYTNIFETNVFGTNILSVYTNDAGAIAFYTNLNFTTTVASSFYQYYAGGYQYNVVVGARTNSSLRGYSILYVTNSVTNAGVLFPIPTNAPPLNLTPITIFGPLLSVATGPLVVNSQFFQPPSVVTNFLTTNSITNFITTIRTTNFYGTNIFSTFAAASTNLTANIVVWTNIVFTNNLLAGVTNVGAFTNYVYRWTNVVSQLGNLINLGVGVQTPIPTNVPPPNLTLNTLLVPPGTLDGVLVVTQFFQLPTTFLTQVVASASSSVTVSNTLQFDDYQMSASFVVPVVPSQVGIGANGAGLNQLLAISLSNPRLDPFESSDLLPPTIDPTGGAGLISILSSTFPVGDSILNFERSTFRVRKNVGNAIVYVTRSGGDPTKSVSVKYRIDFGPRANELHTFPLQAGSDYAQPDTLANPDFTSVTGTLTWPASPNPAAYSPIPITIPILNNGLVEFNQDMQLQLFGPAATADAALGQINTATLTILFDGDIITLGGTVPGQQPAGAVDRSWNKDGFSDSNPPFLSYPGTSGGVSDSANGNGGTVYAVTTQPDGNALIAGSFISYDSHPYNRIVRALPNGYQDPSFLAAPNSGANDFIAAMALQPDGKILVGGNFTSFNGANRHHIARLNTDGSVDPTFNPGLGADGMVWALALQPDGHVILGGEFTSVNGTNRQYVARLNSDGSLDSNFDSQAAINGPIYALALPNATPINASRGATGTDLEDVNSVNLGAATAGVLTVDYDMLSIPDDMRVFYGTTNGVLIYDSGLVSGTNHVVIPFGPTNGLTTNLITIVMNQGNGQPGTFWDYTATVTTPDTSAVYIGGNFDTVAGLNIGGVARLKGDGSVDTTFNPGIGTYDPLTGFTDPVYSLALQPDGKLLAGGGFSAFDLDSYNGIVRLSRDGTVDTSFDPGTGTHNPLTSLADTIYALTLQPDGKILIGGNFTTFNQTRRVGVGRLYADGSVDTTFMDTAYNQFAGLVNHYHNNDAINTNDYPQGNQRNYVYAIGLETGGNVIVGGGFLRVGGGYTRDGTLPRSNVARLIGGATPGPGNIQFSYNNYSVDKNAGNLYVSLVRTNGNLGTINATFTTNTAPAGPGIASAADFQPLQTLPTWDLAWSIAAWMKSDCITGPNYSTTPLRDGLADINLAIVNNTNITGNLSANLGLIAPNGTDLFFLGGENIPLGAALGAMSAAPLTIIDDNIRPGTLSFSSANYTVVENAGSASITVTRTNGTDSIVTVKYATSNGTATNGIDYTAQTGTLTFRGGEASKSFSVPIVNGTTQQPDKTVKLTLFNPTGGATLGLTNAVLTIINDNYGPGHLSFSPPTFSVNENGGSAVITVSRLGGSTGTLSVRVATSDGTATNGINYTGSTNLLTWNNLDATNKTITIPVFDDGLVTSNLTVNLRLYSSVVNTKTNLTPLSFGGTNTTLTIVNVDSAGTVEFSSPAYSVKKYGGFALIPVVRTGGSAQTVSVDYNTVDGTAVAGTNYISTSGTLVFTNGEVHKFINVPIIDDHTVDGPLALSLVLTNVSPTNAAGSPSLATLSIIDTATVNETPGAIDTTYSKYAGFNDAVYALALQGNNQLLVGGDFTMADGVPRQHIARLNANGTLDAGFSLPSSAAGANGTVRTIAIQTDGRILIGGFFTNVNSVVLNRIARLNPDGTLDSLFNPGSGADNSVYALAETFVNGVRKVVIGGGFATVNGTPFASIAQLNSDGTADPSFNPGLGANATVYALAVQTDGKIVIGGDFTAVNGNTNYAHIARLNVDGSLDTNFNPGTGANDSVRAIKIQLDGAILIGGLFTSVNGTSLNHIARLNTNGSVDNSFQPGVGANDAVFSIALQTDNRIVLGGEFTRCSDVTRSRVTRLYPDGKVDPTINFGTGANDFVAALAIQQDTIAGYPTNIADEKIILAGGFTQYNNQPHAHLARIFGGAISGSGAFQFSSAFYQADENSTNVVITIVRTGGTGGTNANETGDIFVPFATTDGTAVAGTNYVAINTNIDFPAGEVVKTVAIPLIDDYVIMPNLTVNLALSDPTPPAEIGNQPTAVLTIINDDSVVNFASATYSVPKNTVNGVASIKVVRQGSVNGTSTVVFNTTTNGTALLGTDYNAATNILLTFNPGVSNVTATVPIINNALPEGYRTVTLQLTNAVGSAMSAPSNAVLTIVDTVNLPGQLTFSATNYVVTETDTNIYLTVLRTNGSAGSVSVSYATQAGTAQPGINYQTVSGNLTFASGESSKIIIVPLVNNNLVQGTVGLTATLSNPTGGATLISPSTAFISIIDDDAGVSFLSATNYVNETNGLEVAFVQRVGNPALAFQVSYATTNGTALAGVSYTAASGTLNFTNGETLKPIPVPILRNTNVTGDLTFALKLFNPTASAQLVSPSNLVVVIQDGDAGISFTNSAISVAKNIGTAVITVICSNPAIEPPATSNSVPLTVNYFTTNGTAQAGVDYVAVSGTLVFVNGIATNTFIVPILNNTLLQGNRTFSVKLANPTAPGKLVAPSTQTVTIVDSNSGLSFSKSSYTSLKTGVAATITVVRSVNTNTVTSVNFATADGSAIAGVDYVPTNGVIVFTNGDLTKTFSVTAIPNANVQPDKVVLLQLSNPTNAILTPPSAATLTIHDTSGSFVVPAGSALVSETGPTNGIIDPGETVRLLFGFRVSGGNNVTNLIATLIATNGVTAPSAAQTYGPLAYFGPSVSRPFTFTAVGTNGQSIAATFQLQDGVANIGTAVFTYSLGSTTKRFTNSAPIIINDLTIASPYPSTIDVSGVGGTIIKATVTLTNMTHASPSDIDVLLVSPDQHDTLIMAHAGGQKTINHVTLTFDDATNYPYLPASSTPLPAGQIVSGTNRPTSFLPVPNFP